MREPSSESRIGEFFCSSFSRNTGEQLFATAVKNRVWFMLEYPFLWGHNALLESALPHPIKDRFTSLLETIPSSRVELIKAGFSSYPRKIAFYVAISDELHPRLYKFQISSYEDLLDMDIPAVISGAEEFQDFLEDLPLILICTNGRRDRCCARFGLPVYSELARLLPGNIGQCTHVGGHRFAANVLCFPHGIYYGRVTQNEAKYIIQALRQGNIFLDKLRGRSCYDRVVQAAEYYLRRKSGELRLSAFQLLGSWESGPDSWLVRFFGLHDDFIHEIELVIEQDGFEVYDSCQAVEKTTKFAYTLRQYQTSKGPS